MGKPWRSRLLPDAFVIAVAAGQDRDETPGPALLPPGDSTGRWDDISLVEPCSRFPRR